MKLIIDRREWLRGEGPRSSKLLRSSDSKRCCVGIYARALGVPDKNILDYVWPNRRYDMDEPVWRADEAPWLLAESTDETMKRNLSCLNDDPFLDDFTRERLIKERFAEHDVEVTFIN